MAENQSHKFQNKIQITYQQLFHQRYTRLVSFFNELEKVIPREELLKVVRDWSERSSIKSVGEERASSFEEFKNYWKTVSYGEYFSQVVSVDFPHESDTELHCNYSECLFAKTFRDLGAEELGLIIGCDQDHSFINTMNPRLKLKRTKTLMEGHDQCNHVFIWED
ncbi:MAG: L-2-amino-thiazoline-4-carboxylic acid hydrolase [Candidatus Thorarchaeota archaeon]